MLFTAKEAYDLMKESAINVEVSNTESIANSNSDACFIPLEDMEEMFKGLSKQQEFEVRFSDAIKALPQSANLNPYLTPVGMQGQKPWCTSWATTHCHETVLKRITGKTIELSETHLWWTYQKLSSWEAANAATKVYAVPDTSWNEFATQGNDGWKDAEISALRGVRELKTIDAACQHIVSGNPVLLSVSGDFSKWYNANGYISHEKTRITGAHAVMIYAYQLDTETEKFPGGGIFFFKNSWSKGWGREGYGAISFQYFTDRYYWTSMLGFSSELTFKETPPAPVPPPKPTELDVQAEVFCKDTFRHGDKTFGIFNVLITGPDSDNVERIDSGIKDILPRKDKKPELEQDFQTYGQPGWHCGNVTVIGKDGRTKKVELTMPKWK